ncbi:type 4a pilus biogenesis protein PilO [Moraxella sp. Tifton1]|uniref:type 4a pilus biogenesis protein PilO n=1 Tax=Moraxella oculi TaxID=2940516 RepID=UPI0020126533|nr:type 4a pilus biogenesis protein PilO [Moraxella sp. Tifton1]MCL1623314.1 type 4a pilus biogenesis protein PilO [Moraxella sp. Tifton1]
MKQLNDGRTIRQTWQQISQLSWENVGAAPWWFKGLIFGVLVMFVMAFGWIMVIHSMVLERRSLATQEIQLMAQYATKYAKAGQLSAVEAQTRILHHDLSAITEQLPNAFDVNSLVEQIHALAMRTGVQVADVKTHAQSETPMFFERGMTLVFVGDYHQLGHLFAELSSLPVPLTFHDFDMAKGGQHQGGSQIRLSIQAKTYRAKTKKELEREAVHADG